MKSRPNPFLRSALFAGISFALGIPVHAANYWYDNNGTGAGFGMVDLATYDWLAGTPWTTTNTGAFTVAGIAWPSGTHQAAFVGAGAGTSYSVILGSSDLSTVTVGNLVLNSDGTNATAIGSGNIVIGGVASNGTLSLGAANSIGTAAGTLTINSRYSLGNNQSTNFRGGTVIINGAISGSGTSGVVLASGAFALTSGTLTLAGDNTFAGNTSVASGYILNLQHANALGAVGGTNTVASGATMEVASGVSIVSGESVSIAGDGVSSLGALRAGIGGGTWAGGVTLSANARLGATSGNTLTVTGNVGGAAGSALGISGQGGTGVVILNPTTSNTYAGATNIIRGILRLGKTDALPTGTTLDVDSANSVLDAATFDMASFSQTVVVLQDSATSNINGVITNSVASTTSTLTVNQASNTIYDSTIQNGSGTVILTKGGVGNLTLNGANTYTGGTNIKNGSITIGGNNDRLATGGSVVLGDVSTTGKLVLGDATTARNQTLAGLTISGSGGSVVGAHATNNSVLTLAIASGTNSFAGILGGAGTNENKLALTKTGAGTLNLTNANTHSGATTLTTGTTQIGIASVGSVGAITSGAIGTGTLTFNGGTLSSDGGTARTILNAVTFSGNAGLGDATNNGKLTFGAGLNLGAAARTITVNSEVQLDGSFTNSATASGLIKNGVGTLTINSANTSFGNTNGFTIQAGTVVATNTASMGNAGQIVSLGTSTTTGILDLATDTSANAYVINLGSGNTGTVIVNRANSAANMTHTLGTVTLGNGTLNIQDGSNVTGDGTLEFAGITMSAGASGLSTGTMLNPTSGKVLVSGNITRTGGLANLLTLDGTNAGNLISGSISGSQALTKSNSSTWELSNANTFTGRTLVTGGTLKLTNNLALQSSAFDTSGAGTLDITTINTPTLGGLIGDAGTGQNLVLHASVTGLTLNPSAGTLTYVKDISRTGGGTGLTLTKTGAGTQILSGTNNYTGLTTVSGGELRVTTAAAIGGSSVTVTAGQLALDGGITVSGKSLTTSGSGANFFGGLQSFTGTNEWAGSVLLGADLSRLGARRNATLVLSGAIDDGANTFTAVFRNENQNNTSGAGNSTTVTEVSGISTYGGNTQLIAGVTRLAGGDNRLPTGTILQFGGTGANAKFDMNGRSQEVAGLAVMNTTTDTQRDWNANELTNSSGTLSTLTVNTTADQTFGLTPTNFGGRENYTGSITGNIELVKSGAARLTLSGTNTYTGATTVTNGTLVINGSISTSTLTTVNPGATLAGSGTLGKTVINGTLAVGNSPGTMIFTDTLGLNGSAVMEIDGMSGAGVLGGHDFINLTGAGPAGTLTYGGMLSLDLGVTFATGSYSWDLFDMASDTGAFTSIALADQYSGNLLDDDLNGIWDLTSGDNTWQFTQSSGVLALTVIPEPSVAVLLGGLGSLTLLRRRRMM